MHETVHFGLTVLVVSTALLLALVAVRATDRLPLPGAALFLIGAAIAADLWPRLGDMLSIQAVERLATVALIVILFDGGLNIGWRRFRIAWVPIVSLGVAGTVLATGALALVAHGLFQFPWLAALVLGAALAPTDPAVTFSVLGGQQIRGRSGTILEGESGANDPVSIALMIGLIELSTKGGSGWIVVQDFAIEMTVGVAIGIAGGLLLRGLVRRPFPEEALYGLRTLAVAGVIYGLAAVAHGSGFIAVFVAGILLGDVEAPQRDAIRRFHSMLSSIAEIVVFLALGLTIELSSLRPANVWAEGLALAVLLAFVVRPLTAGALLLPVRLRGGERLFVLWGGLKGAVPILLGTFVLLGGVEDADRIYGIIFVVVLFSVVVQGGSIPWAARRLGVPMRASAGATPPSAPGG